MTVYKPMGAGVQESKAGQGYHCGNNTLAIYNATNPVGVYTGAFTSLLSFSRDADVAGTIWNMGGVAASDVYFLLGTTTFAFTNGNGMPYGVSAPVVSKTINTAVGTYNGSQMSLWMNGVKAGDRAESGFSIHSAGYALGCDCVGTASTFAGSIYRHLVFNYALPEDKIKRYSAGAKLDWDDIGGSMTALGITTWYNDGSYDAGTWAQSGGNITRAVASMAGKWARSNTFSFVAGKKYQLNITVTGTIGANTWIALYTSNGGTIQSNKVILATGAQTVVFTATATNAVGVILVESDAVPVDFGLSITASYQLGAVLDLEPESATPSTWHDESGNQLDGTVTGATLIDVPHFANTDYGLAAVKQELIDNSADKPSYYFSSAATNTIQTGTSAALAVGASDCTLFISGKFPQSASSEQYLRLFVDTSNFLTIEKNTDNTFQTRQMGGGVLSTTSSTEPITDNMPQALVIQRSSDTVSLWKNGILSKRATATQQTLVGNPYALVGEGSASIRNGMVSRSLIFNYALDENKIRRYSAGAKLDYEDVGGSMVVTLTNPDFEGGFTGGLANGWSKMGANATPTQITGRSGSGSAQRLTVGSTVDNDVGLTQGTYTAGRTYRARYWVRCSRIGVTIRFQTGSNSHIYTIQQANTWEMVVTTRLLQASAIMYLYADTGFSAGDTIDFDDIIDQVGAVLDLEPENITDTMWVDASPNGLHGTVSGALANRFMPSYSSKNWVINGGMDFWQRGASTATNGNYGADRWWLSHAQTTASLNSSADGAGFVAQLLLTTRAAGGNGSVSMKQPFETLNARLLAGKTVTLSFLAQRGVILSQGWMRAMITWGTGTDQKDPTGGASLQQIVPVTSIPNGSYQRFSFTFAIPATATSLQVLIGMFDDNGVTFTLPNNSPLFIKEVMLNEGPVAAPFERAGGTIGGELALCQRYCYSLGTSGSSGIFSRMTNYISGAMYFSFRLASSMRTTPTLYTSGAETTNWYISTTAQSSQTGFSFSVFAGASSPEAICVQANKAAHGLTDSFMAIKSGVVLESEL